MNLIEQFGSYENAAKFCDKEIKQGFYPYDLVQALLEYRRENNIFEEHDWVVIPSRGNGLFSVSRLLRRSDRDEMRHATDKEIAQGYRDE